jgi:ABC-type glycerol-3-phosphate transport system substrate-binding protein
MKKQMKITAATLLALSTGLALASCGSGTTLGDLTAPTTTTTTVASVHTGEPVRCTNKAVSAKKRRFHPAGTG